MGRKYIKISEEKAFYIGITMWGMLYLFPNIKTKNKLPRILWNIIKDLYFNCPCCAVYYNKKTGECHNCPLENNCIRNWKDSFYRKWSEATTDSTRKYYAKLILDAILYERNRK